jgi:hypothetical protein
MEGLARELRCVAATVQSTEGTMHTNFSNLVDSDPAEPFDARQRIEWYDQSNEGWLSFGWDGQLHSIRKVRVGGMKLESGDVFEPDTALSA